jgi:hypothetical protein
MVFGVPGEVKKFFSPALKDAAQPIRKALAAMVLCDQVMAPFK